MMFFFGSAEADRAFAFDVGVLGALATGAFFVLVWLAGIIERAIAARYVARRWPR